MGRTALCGQLMTIAVSFPLPFLFLFLLFLLSVNTPPPPHQSFLAVLITQNKFSLRDLMSRLGIGKKITTQHIVKYKNSPFFFFWTIGPEKIAVYTKA